MRQERPARAQEGAGERARGFRRFLHESNRIGRAARRAGGRSIPKATPPSRHSPCFVSLRVVGGTRRTMESKADGGSNPRPAGSAVVRRASCPIPFPWHQIQRTDIRFQGKTGTVLLRPRGTLPGEISLCFHLKCSKSVPLLPRRARAKESASPIPALPVLRVPPGGGRTAPDDGVKSRWRIEPPTGWKRGRTTGVLARRLDSFAGAMTAHGVELIFGLREGWERGHGSRLGRRDLHPPFESDPA
jgi:hypothetical protein